MDQSNIPPEEKLDLTWKEALENVVAKSLYGAVIGGIASFVLFRGHGTRTVITCYSAGVGGGLGFADTKNRIEGKKYLNSSQLPDFIKDPKSIPSKLKEFSISEKLQQIKDRFKKKSPEDSD